MIKEAYCSFEVSKLLKEKGFDESIFEFYVGSKDNIKYARNKEGFRLSELDSDFYYPHITHQMACAWLREKYGYHIYTFYENEFHWHYVIDSLTKKWRYSVSENKSNDEAIEKALKYSLKKLI